MGDSNSSNRASSRLLGLPPDGPRISEAVGPDAIGVPATECHDSASKKGGLDLSRRTSATQGGESGKAIVPGKRDDSLLWQYVESGEMPPDNRPRLSDEEKQPLRDWIDSGATWTSEVIDPSAAFSTENQVVQTWMRRLTVPEYIETVRSAVGVDITAGREASPAAGCAGGWVHEHGL